MPKKPNLANPKCPFCNKRETVRQGYRKSKNRQTQKYQCKNKECKKYFTTQPSLQKYKTYPIHIILNAISNYNLGYSLKQTKNYFKKHKIKSSTLSYWHNLLKPFLPYHRIRNKITQNYKPIEIIKKKKFIHHNQPFLYQHHKPKADLFLKNRTSLKHYLENIENLLPEGIFNNSERVSQIAKETRTRWRDEAGVVLYGVPSRFAKPSNEVSRAQKMRSHFLEQTVEANVVVGVSNKNLKIKQNYATKLADIALQITEDNQQRHRIIENLMLKNDTATIATEIPIYLKLKNNTITGHIDILQIRFNKLHILDFKPEKINKEEAITQLYLYAAALSKITSIPLKKFQCAFFNNKAYYEFCPKFLSGIPR